MKKILLIFLFVFLWNGIVSGQSNKTEVEKITSKFELAKKNEEAIKYLDEIISSYPNETYLYELKANFQRRQRKFDEAILTISKAIKIEPSNVSLYIEKAQLYQGKNDRKLYLKTLDEAISNGSNDYSALFNIAKELHRGEYYEKSLKILESITIKDTPFPDDHVIYKLRYKNKFALKDYHGAMDDAINAIKVIPVSLIPIDRFDSQYGKASIILGNLQDFKIDQILIKLKDDERVFEYYQNIIELYEEKARLVLENPPIKPGDKNQFELYGARYSSNRILLQSNQLLMSLAKLYDSKGNAEKAEEILAKLVSNPIKWFNYSYRANYFKEKGKYQDAINDLTKAIYFYQDTEEVRSERILLELETNSSLSLTRNWKFYALIRRGDLFVLTKQFDKAILDYETAINLKPKWQLHIEERITKAKAQQKLYENVKESR